MCFSYTATTVAVASRSSLHTLQSLHRGREIALNKLGWHTHHFCGHLVDLSTVSCGGSHDSEPALRKEYADMFDGHSDLAPALVYRQLARAFPDSLFVYTTRPVVKWSRAMIRFMQEQVKARDLSQLWCGRCLLWFPLCVSDNSNSHSIAIVRFSTSPHLPAAAQITVSARTSLELVLLGHVRYPLGLDGRRGVRRRVPRPRPRCARVLYRWRRPS